SSKRRPGPPATRRPRPATSGCCRHDDRRVVRPRDGGGVRRRRRRGDPRLYHLDRLLEERPMKHRPATPVQTKEEPPMSDAEVLAYDDKLFPELLRTDPESVMARFAERFVKAETLDDLFDVLEGNLSRSLIGHKVRVQAVAWAPYQSDR